MRRVVSAVVVAALLAGCVSSSSSPAPGVAAYPSKGQSPEQQARDSSDCQVWAKQQAGYDPAADTAKSAGVGLLLGAVAGAAIGAAAGNAGKGAAIGAAVGGVGGTAVGAGYGYTANKDGYDRAFAACMQSKGYSVSH